MRRVWELFAEGDVVESGGKLAKRISEKAE
jgi:hypothetical protein